MLKVLELDTLISKATMPLKCMNKEARSRNESQVNRKWGCNHYVTFGVANADKCVE